MNTSFAPLGNDISEIEITHISKYGLWLLLNESELFMSFTDFPWFRNATIATIQDVEYQHQQHLYWPQLDIDISVESVKHPERFPLIARN